MAFIAVAALDDLWDGEMLGRVVGGRKILIVRLDGRIYAFADRCAHLGMALSNGDLDGHVLTCGAHHYQYDARTGEGVNPRSVRIPGYPVKVENGEILVDADQPVKGASR